jgi:hypothetical protein
MCAPPPTCRTCTAPLRKSYSILLAVGSIGLAYICRVCRLVYVYAPDLTPIGRLTRGERNDVPTEDS